MRYLYTIYVLLLFVLLFLILLPLFFIFNFLGEFGWKCEWVILKGWAFVWPSLIGIWKKVSFHQKPDKNKKYIFIANHTSFLDTPMIFIVSPIPVLTLATKEFAKIPLFGFLYRQMTIMVDRKDDTSRKESVREMEIALNGGKSLWLFPEGRMNDSEHTLQKFYNGAFKLSLSTQTPIMPVVFLDSNKRWHPKNFWAWSPGKSRALFLPEIKPHDAGQDTTDTLREKAWHQMKRAIEANR